MIGNDIVDLALAQKESNWKRKGFLGKIFTQKEQFLILNSQNPETMVWNLWSRKEAAYKIYNRESGIRAYFPLKLECYYENETSGTVTCNGNIYLTKTNCSDEFVHSIAVENEECFNAIKSLNPNAEISKINGVPFLIDPQTNKNYFVSISHHGRFWVGIKLSM